MDVDAIVVGAGFAGLSAATALAEHGWRVRVFEARPSLGGRASAFTDPATGERVDNGQHAFFGCYHDTFRFLRRIGTGHHVRLQTGLVVEIIDRHGHASTLACPALPAPLHLLAGVLRWNGLPLRDRLSVLRMHTPLREARRQLLAGGGDTAARATDAAASGVVRDWLLRHHQSPRLIELLWEPLAVAALNQSIDVAAAEVFAAVVARMFGPERRDASIGLSDLPLDELYGEPSKRYIESRGGEVRTGSPVRLRCGASGVSVDVRGESHAAPAVICAVPWHALSDTILSPLPALAATLRAADATQASPIVTVNLWLDPHPSGPSATGLPGRHFQWLFDKGLLFGERASHLALVASDAGALVGRSNPEIVDVALSELRAALPGLRASRVARAVVVREKRASFSVAPGQPPRPPVRTGVSGLYLAGDWIDTGLPATIEGAALSGHLAAAAAIADSR